MNAFRYETIFSKYKSENIHRLLNNSKIWKTIIVTQRRSGASQHMTKIALRCIYIYKSYIFNRMRIYSTVQLCSITSLWHSGQRYAVQSGGCRFESLWGFGFSLKGALYQVDYCGKKTSLAGLQCTLTSSCATKRKMFNSHQFSLNRSSFDRKRLQSLQSEHDKLRKSSSNMTVERMHSILVPLLLIKRS